MSTKLTIHRILCWPLVLDFLRDAEGQTCKGRVELIPMEVNIVLQSRNSGEGFTTSGDIDLKVAYLALPMLVLSMKFASHNCGGRDEPY